MLAGCAAPSPYGVYSQGHAFWGESIELRDDQTFTYYSVNDDFSEQCTVEGVWAVDTEKPNVVVLQVESITTGEFSDSCDDKPNHKAWIVRATGLVSASKSRYRDKLERRPD